MNTGTHRPLSGYASPTILLLLFVTQLFASAAFAAGPGLKFAWPVPSTVKVTETALKKGKTAKMRYDAELTRQESGKKLEMRIKNFEFVDLEGIDLTVAENREKLGPSLDQITAIKGMFPTLVIDQEGYVEDVAGIEEMIEGAAKLLKGLDEKQRQSIIAFMRSPQTLSQIKEDSARFWQVWVETWIALEPLKGKEQVYEGEIALLDGSTVKSELTLKYVGDSPSEKGCVDLTAYTLLDGEDAKKAMSATLQALMAQVKTPEGVMPLSIKEIKNMKRTTRFVVVTDPKTLQPKKAGYEVVTELEIADKKQSSVEKHEYLFDWNEEKRTGQ